MQSPMHCRGRHRAYALAAVAVAAIALASTGCGGPSATDGGSDVATDVVADLGLDIVDGATDTTPQDVPIADSVDVPPADVPGDVPGDTGPMCATGEIVCDGACVDAQTNPNHCGACGRTCSGADVCRAGVCSPAVMCATGQLYCGGGCVDPMTDRNHCGMCDRACAMTEVCSAGTCRTPMTCPTGQTACGTMCVNLQTNNMHCGLCGNACTGTDTCVMGACQPPSCPTGQTRCGVTCVNLTNDNSNCGACGTVCPVATRCTGSTCVSTCVAPRRLCTIGGTQVCIDVTTDESNCGACGNVCTSGRECRTGVCQCPVGRTTCSGMCVDTQTDEAHCGACGTRCGSAQQCLAGVCRCPTGSTACGTNCVDTSSDINNCGRCGLVCTTPSTCNAGVCNSLCGPGTTSCGGRCVATSSFQTDRANCGRCGNACTGTDICLTGGCRPSNDPRSGARAVSLSAAREVVVTGTTVNATHDAPTSSCGCTSAGDVWYRFSVPAAGVVYVDTAGSSFDTSLMRVNSTGTSVTQCNDDANCGTTAGWTSNYQSRLYFSTSGAGSFDLAVSGCGTGAFTLRFQFLPQTVARSLFLIPLAGTGTVASSLSGTSTTSSTCGGTASGETAYWFVTCGRTETFSLCRSDPGAQYLRRSGIWPGSGVYFDPALYIRSAQTGAQVACNDDGTSMGGTDCRGEVELAVPPFRMLLSEQYGSRLNAIATPRGINAVIVDERTGGPGLGYHMYFDVN